MKLTLRNIFLSGAIYLYSVMTCNAQSMDSIASPSDYSLLSMQYIWLHTSNPVAYLNVKSNPMNGQISYNHISGDYKYITDPQSMNRGNIAVEGFKKVNKLQFYGSFSYDISKLNEQRWKNVLMPSTGNPFILGDSIGGNYDNETFEIKGIVTSSFNEKLKWGIAASYKGGSSADQNDPRPKIDAVRYSIRPGVMYNFDDWNIGLNLEYEGYEENIAITSVETTKTHRFFLFQGLGNYFQTSGIGYRRHYKGNTSGGDIQIIRKYNSFENILQLGYRNKIEKSEDGESGSFFKSGDYKEAKYSLMNLFSIKRNHVSHLIKLSINHYSSKGTWYDQQKITNNNDQQIWVVYNKSVKYKDNATTAGFEYTWLKEKQGFKDYTLSSSVEMEQHKTSFLPEMYLQKYSNIKASLQGGKTYWLPNKFQLGVNLGASYQKNISSKGNFEGIALANIWSYPVFEYLTSDYYTGSVSAKLSKRTLLGNLPAILYLFAGINYAKSSLATDNFNKPNRIVFMTTAGFTF